MVTIFEWLSGPVWHRTLFILLVSALLSFTTSLIRLRLTKKDQLKQINAWKREIESWNSKLKEARRIDDKKLIKKLQKKERRIKQIQAKMSTQSLGQSMRMSLIFFFPFLIVWLFLTGRILVWNLFETPLVNNICAYIPWFGGPMELNLFYWYLICSLASGAIIARLLGIEMGAG
jgi:uncharacterized membrane protein (DUF106 family)